MTLHTSSESFCIEKCYPSFTKRKKFPNYFSVVFRHLSRQQRALAPLFCAKANPLPLEFISLFFLIWKKVQGLLILPSHTKPEGRIQRLFLWSHVCWMDSRIGWGCRLSSDTHKKEKKNRKPSTHTKSNQAGRENQVCHIPMELPQKKKKTKQNKKWNRAVGRHWAKPAGGDARPPPGQGRGRRLPGATCPAAGADSRRGRSWLGGKHRPATWVHLGRCWNEFVSEPEYFKIEGQATTGVRGEGRKD